MLSANEVLSVVAQLYGALLRSFEGVENGECLLKFLRYLLLYPLRNTQLVVQPLDCVYLLGIAQILA